MSATPKRLRAHPAMRPEPFFFITDRLRKAASVGKFGWTAIGVLVAAFVADQYWNYGYYTDSALAMLRQIRQSFGW